MKKTPQNKREDLQIRALESIMIDLKNQMIYNDTEHRLYVSEKNFYIRKLEKSLILLSIAVIIAIFAFLIK